jgi:HflK protein
MTGKRHEKTLIGAALLLIPALALDLFVQRMTGLLVCAALLPFAITALVVSALVYARKRLQRLTDEEARAAALAREEVPESTLFEQDEDAEPFTIARSRRQFERFIVPLAAPLLALIELLFAWHLYRRIDPDTIYQGNYLLTAAFLGGQAFVLFILSRYMLGLSRAEEHRALRGPGVYLGLFCFATLIALVTAVLHETGIARADFFAAWLLLLALTLLGLENAISTLGEMYRPRKRDHELNYAYESRVGALLTDPGTWVRNVAQAVDYQFGFTVSETWFYRFLENALIPLFIFQLVVLYLLSSLVFLGPEEEGLLERFGKPVSAENGGALLESGFHLKWPAPIETVRRFDTRRIRSIHVGFAAADGHEHAMPDVLLWTIPHHGAQELFPVAHRAPENTDGTRTETVPVSFLSVHMPVQYRITNVYQFAYNYSDPEKLLEQIAYRNMTREAVGRDLFELVGGGQLEVAAKLRDAIQADVNERQMGLRIEFVGLQGVHPPTQIADAFEGVIGALEEKEATILEARAYTNRVLPEAAAEAHAAEIEAQAYRARRIALAASETYRFEQRLGSYHTSPEVFKTDIYLRTLSDALVGTRKYIISAVPATEVIQFDFEEKANPDLFDFGPTLEGSNP